MSQQSEEQAEVAQETDDALTEEQIWAELESEDEEVETPEEPEAEQDDEEPEEDDEPDQPERSPEQPDRQPEQRSETEEPEQSEPEWWKSLDDDAKKEIQQTFSQQEQQLQRMQQQYNSLHGKVAPTQRELEKARKEYAALEKRLQAYENAPSSLEELEKSEAFKNLLEDAPEDADALKKAVSLLVSQREEDARAKLESTERALVEEREARTQRELNRLQQAHPDWQPAIQSNEFTVWRNALPQDQQQTVKQMLASPYADENIEVLNAFKRDLQAARGSTQTTGDKPQGSQPSQKTTPQRRKPPQPSPGPEGSGVSGSRRIPAYKSEEELWAEIDEDEMRSLMRG